MARRYGKERFPYSVYPTENQYADDAPYFVCLMPDAATALEVASTLLQMPAEKLTVHHMHNGYVSEFMLSRRGIYGYCSHFRNTPETKTVVDLVFRYPWVNYRVPTRKQIIKEILMDLKAEGV